MKIKLQSIEKVLIAAALLEALAYYGYLYVGIPMLAAPTSFQMLGVIWAVCSVVTLVYALVYVGLGVLLVLRRIFGEIFGLGDPLRKLVKWFSTDDRN